MTHRLAVPGFALSLALFMAGVGLPAHAFACDSHSSANCWIAQDEANDPGYQGYSQHDNGHHDYHDYHDYHDDHDYDDWNGSSGHSGEHSANYYYDYDQFRYYHPPSSYHRHWRWYWPF